MYIMGGHKVITFGDLIKRLALLKAEYGLTMDTPVVYSHDDEGNEFQAVVNMPEVMYTSRVVTYGGRDLDCYVEPIGTKVLCLN